MLGTTNKQLLDKIYLQQKNSNLYIVDLGSVSKE